MDYALRFLQTNKGIVASAILEKKKHFWFSLFLLQLYLIKVNDKEKITNFNNVLTLLIQKTVISAVGCAPAQWVNQMIGL